MIVDTLEQHHPYLSFSPRFAAAFAFLQNVPANIPLGRHDIDGDNCFALVQTYTSKPLTQAKFEAHKKYLDIQFIQSGRETLLWAPLAACTQITEPYLEEKDVMFFALPAAMTQINLRAGEFAIFSPTDGHAPGVEYGGAVEVRKIVIKVRV